MNFVCIHFRYYSNQVSNVMKILNVAEKNDAAKTISNFLSNGTARRVSIQMCITVDGCAINISHYHYCFVNCRLRGCHNTTKYIRFPHNFADKRQTWWWHQFRDICWHMNLSAVTVAGRAVIPLVCSMRQWSNNAQRIPWKSRKRWREKCVSMFPNFVIYLYIIHWLIPNSNSNFIQVRSCGALIIWTDCDREGENIGYEIIDVCRSLKPNIPVYRAKFSEITAASIKRALQNIGQPDERQSQAVDVRSELDLRIGAAFTRFQTLRYQSVFPTQVDGLVSYGSCQIPTLGFVARRFMEVEKFIPQPFWKIKS